VNLRSTASASRQDRAAEEPINPREYRTPFQRDCDRILYSSAFRRLAGVTQVVDVFERQLFHNRLTHTLKVSQVGRRLAELLLAKYADHQEVFQESGGIDVDVVEAACRAHDLGHPPFGHIAEEELQKCAKSWNEQRGERRGAPLTPLDSFEGNAQSFRIINKLAVRTARLGRIVALNLTRATLAATLKYPWLSDDERANSKRKWGAYLSEADEWLYATRLTPPPTPSIEAQIMDWADDVTYAVHDLEDFIRSGHVPLAQLVSESGADEQARFITRTTEHLSGKTDISADEIQRAFIELKKRWLPRAYTGDTNSRAELHDAASGLITQYLHPCEVRDGSLWIDRARVVEVNVLKQLIDSPSIAARQRGQREVIASLFSHLVAWMAEAIEHPDELRRLPVALRSYYELSRGDPGMQAWARQDDELIGARAVVDFISSLSEGQAVELHGRLTGVVDTSAFTPWL
jgi:dGTPase